MNGLFNQISMNSGNANMAVKDAKLIEKMIGIIEY